MQGKKCNLHFALVKLMRKQCANYNLHAFIFLFYLVRINKKMSDFLLTLPPLKNIPES